MSQSIIYQPAESIFQLRMMKGSQLDWFCSRRLNAAHRECESATLRKFDYTYTINRYTVTIHLHLDSLDYQECSPKQIRISQVPDSPVIR